MSITQTPAADLSITANIGDWDYIDLNVGQPPLPHDGRRLEHTAYPFLEQQLLAERFLRRIPQTSYRDRSGTWKPIRRDPRTFIAPNSNVWLTHTCDNGDRVSWTSPIPPRHHGPRLQCPHCTAFVDYPQEHHCFDT